ncbi:MAG: DUF6465 family protein [Eubacteriales bacterium]|nr:DUF6465 family protein [Eubacteriales bacterium]
MAKKTREELAEIEFAALASAIMEMESIYNDADAPDTGAHVMEAFAAGAAVGDVPGEETAPAPEPAPEKPKRARSSRKKAMVPNVVIQNQAGDSITYEAVVKKVNAAVEISDIRSLDIYVKAVEGKAYYVVNGEAAGAVDLF